MTQRVRISVLGGFRIETGGLAREDRLPRKLAALVAVLAVAGGKGVGRERIVSLLWAETDEEKGRHALAQTVYTLRRMLGLGDLIQGTDRLVLNEETVATDLNDLRAAVAAGNVDRVLELARGTLLDGVSLPGSGAFERWLEDERRDYQRTLIVALDRLASATTDLSLAVTLRRRRVDLDPLDAVGAMSLMRSLAAAGDLPGATQHARVYGELVRQELELEPDPRVSELVLELQAARTSAPSVSARVSGAPAATVAYGRLAREQLHAIVGGFSRWWRLATRRVSWRLVRRASVVAVSGVAILLALAHYGTEHVVPDRPPPRVAVLPFVASGATAEVEFLRSGLVDLLGHALAERDTLAAVAADEVAARWPLVAGLPGPDSARAIAVSLGATRLVTGTVVGTAQRLIVRTQLVDEDARPVATVQVSGPLDSIAPMVRRAATQLVAAAHGVTTIVGARDLAPRVFRSWMQGLDHYRRGRWTDARRAFTVALGADSSFHVAAVYLALAADWLDDVAVREQALDHLAGRLMELPPIERALALALRHPQLAVPPTAEQYFARWEDAARVGDQALWWVEVGRRYVADGVAAGVPDAARRASRAFARAWAIDSADVAVATVLAGAPGQGSASATTEPTLVAQWRDALRSGNEASLARLRAVLPAQGDGDLRAVSAAMLADGLASSEMERLVTFRMNAAYGSWGRRDAALSAHALAVDRGNGAMVREAVARIDQLASYGAGERLAILDALYGGADTAGVAAIVERVVARGRLVPTTHDQRRAATADRCVVEQWRAWRNERPTPGALALLAADSLGPGSLAAAVSGQACAALVASIRERSAGATAAVATTRAEQLALAGPLAGDLRQYATLALARVRHTLGDHDGAWRLIQRRPPGRGWPRYLAAYDHLEGLIATARADTAAARAALRRYLARRNGADTVFAHDVDEARRQLERLAPDE